MWNCVKSLQNNVCLPDEHIKKRKQKFLLTERIPTPLVNVHLKNKESLSPLKVSKFSMVYKKSEIEISDVTISVTRPIVGSKLLLMKSNPKVNNKETVTVEKNDYKNKNAPAILKNLKSPYDPISTAKTELVKKRRNDAIIVEQPIINKKSKFESLPPNASNTQINRIDRPSKIPRYVGLVKSKMLNVKKETALNNVQKQIKRLKDQKDITLKFEHIKKPSIKMTENLKIKTMGTNPTKVVHFDSNFEQQSKIKAEPVRQKYTKLIIETADIKDKDNKEQRISNLKPSKLRQPKAKTINTKDFDSLPMCSVTVKKFLNELSYPKLSNELFKSKSTKPSRIPRLNLPSEQISFTSTKISKKYSNEKY